MAVRIDHVPETDCRRFASGSTKARHESERRLSQCRRADHHAAGQCLCHTRHDAGGPAGGEISTRSILSTIGGQLLEGYVPEIDATVVERILDAGGEIAGKAVCEYYCVSSGSHTSSTGPV